jgi:hypothetical protein
MELAAAHQLVAGQYRLHLTRIRAVQPKIREQHNHVVGLPMCAGALQRSRVSNGKPLGL